MTVQRFREVLLPGGAEKDEGFRREIDRLSVVGLRVAGKVTIGVSVVFLIARIIMGIETPLWTELLQTSSFVVYGAFVLIIARTRWARAHARGLAAAAGMGVAALATSLSAWSSNATPLANELLPGQITMVMLVGVAAVPLRPLQTTAFGLGLTLIYVGTCITAQSMGLGTGPKSTYVLFTLTLTVFSTALTSVVYEQRLRSYRMHKESLRTAEELRQAQSRILLSENAASLGRLAAALSHELNSPIGALSSAVDTLLLLASRQAVSSPSEQQRLVLLQNEVRKTIQDSARRLAEIAARMQRFTNLDKAEAKRVDLNDLIADVAELLKPNLQGKATLELKLEPLPAVWCRPQQISAVLHNLLTNAANAIDGGNRSGEIVLRTRASNSHIEVEVTDNGSGLPPEALENIFDPGFRVTGDRVSTGNWGMFSSRQIVREHGGEISIVSTAGSGTRVKMSLPCGDRAEASAAGA
jgi:Signal transduction histidine kinase